MTLPDNLVDRIIIAVLAVLLGVVKVDVRGLGGYVDSSEAVQEGNFRENMSRINRLEAEVRDLRALIEQSQ